MSNARAHGSRSRVIAGVSALLMVVGTFVGITTLVPAAPAAAAPGNPGVPSPAVEIYHEGLENGTGATAIRLPNYVGAEGETYTSDPFWVRQDQCNGVVLRYTDTVFPSGFCTTGNSSQNNVRRLADVLGQVEAGVAGSTNPAAPVNGSTSATQANHAITAWTGNVNGPNDAVTLETPPFDLTGSGARFYTAAVNVAELSCTYQGGVNNSRLTFSLVAGGQQLPLTNAPIRACTDPDVRYFTSPSLPGGWGNGGSYVAAGQFSSDSSYLVDSDMTPSMSLRMRNLVGSSQGNDFAYDEVRLFDATPQLDKAFSPASVPVNGTSTLTFTVTNTDELAEKRGWSFTDTLQTGLVIADPANIGGTCEATVTAAAGSGRIDITDGVLNTGQASCTITVDVTSDSPGPADESPVVYANCAENMTFVGLNPPNCAEVEFYTEPHLTLAKSTTGTDASREGDTVSYTVTAVNDGTGDYTAANPAVVVDDMAGVLDDATLVDGSLRASVDGAPAAVPTRDGDRWVWEGPLPVGATLTVTYDVVLTGAGDRTVANTAFVSDEPYDPTDPPATPECTPDGEVGDAAAVPGSAVCTRFGLPGITIEKTTVEQTYDWGTTIRYRFVVTNTGAVALSDVAVNDVQFDGTGSLSAISCPSTDLAAGASMTCEATYTASGADIDQQELNNTATATGTPPAGDPVTSEPDDHRIPAVYNPGIEVQKYTNATDITEIGQEVTYWFRVFNRGNVTLDDVQLTEVEFSGTGELTVTCPTTTLAAFEDMTCRATYVVTQEDVDAGQLTNTVRVTGDTPTGEELTDEDTVRVPSDPNPSLELKKFTATNELVAGQTITYWFSVENTGNVTLTVPTVSEVSFTGSGEVGPITCEPFEGDFYPSRVVWCSTPYTVTQADVDAGRVDNTAVANAETRGDDPQPVVSNEADWSVPSVQNPGLTLEKTADVQQIAVGQPVTFTFRVTNTGNVTVGNVGITEIQFTGTGDMTEVVCPADALIAPGASVECTATYTPTQADVDQGGIKNTAVAEANQSPNGEPVSSPPDEVTVPGGGNPALAIVKSASTSTLVVGETVTYTFEIENTGDVTLTDVGVAEGEFTGSGDLSAIVCDAAAERMEPGDTTTCTATYEVTQADVDQGSVRNTATATGTPPEGGDPVSSPPDEATVSAEQDPSVALEKSADTDTLVVGETITYSFLVTNTGNVTLTGGIITEEEWTGSGDAPEIVCPTESRSLAPGETVTCTAEYVVTQADVDRGSIYNQAVVSGQPPSGDRVYSDPSDVTVAADSDPQLTLVKSNDAGETLAVGQTVTYTFVVTNTGNVTVTDPSVSETSFSGAGDMSALECVLPDRSDEDPAGSYLRPEEQMICEATYEVQQADVDAGVIVNVATADGTDPSGRPVVSEPDESRAPGTQDPAIEMVKSADRSEFAAGDTITYSFRVTNTGNVTLTGVSVDEGRFTGSGELSPITCTPSTLAPGQSVTCTATYTATQEDVDRGTIENAATATGTPPGGEPVSSDPSEAIVTADPQPGISLVKSASPEAYGAGDTITYTFTVTNTGNVTLDDVAVDEGAFTGTGELSAVVCDPTTLAPGASVDCAATYTATQADVDRGSLRNEATAGGTPPGGADPVTSDPSEVTLPAEDPAPGISIVKSADRTELVEGETVTYSFLVTNTGTVTLTDVAVVEGEFTGTGALSEIECPAGAASLAPGAQVVCTATYVVTGADVAAGTIENSATATGTTPGGDRIESDPSAVRVPQAPAPGVSLVKSAEPAAGGAVGDTVTYSFVVTNTGNQPLTGVTVEEGDFSGTGALSAITCPDGADTLVPGESVTCTATYVLTQADVDAGRVANSATAAGTPPGGEPVTSPPSEAVVPIPPAPGISIVKSADKTELVAGETITYSFLVENTGTVTLTDVTIDEGEFTGTGELSAVVCEDGAASLAPGGTVTCTATYTVTPEDVERGSVDNTATATGAPPSGDPVVSEPSAVRLPQDPQPGIAIVKTADTEQVSEAGQVVTYSFMVTNTGNTTLTDVRVDDSAFSGAGELSEISCPAEAARLVPGQTVVCTATYTVLASDLTGDGLSNVAVAEGTPPGAEAPIVSPPSEVVIDTVVPPTPAPTPAPTPPAPQPPIPGLPVTGGELSTGIVLLALLLLVGGAALAGAARRRRAEKD